jgi:hypothetical protein
MAVNPNPQHVQAKQAAQQSAAPQPQIVQPVHPVNIDIPSILSPEEAIAPELKLPIDSELALTLMMREMQDKLKEGVDQMAKMAKEQRDMQDKNNETIARLEERIKSHEKNSKDALSAIEEVRKKTEANADNYAKLATMYVEDKAAKETKNSKPWYKSGTVKVLGTVVLGGLSVAAYAFKK